MDSTIFARRLKEARAASKLTQTELSKLSGVTPATISAYECADGLKGKNPSLDNALKLAQALNVSLDWLCGSIVSSPKIQITDFLKLLVRLNENITSVSVDEVNFAIGIHREVLPNANNLITFDDWTVAQNRAEYTEEEVEYYLYPLAFNDYLINKFLKEWQKVRKLYESNTIDRSLYSLWLDKQYAEIDKKQKEDEEKNNELFKASNNTED